MAEPISKPTEIPPTTMAPEPKKEKTLETSTQQPVTAPAPTQPAHVEVKETSATAHEYTPSTSEVLDYNNPIVSAFGSPFE